MDSFLSSFSDNVQELLEKSGLTTAESILFSPSSEIFQGNFSKSEIDYVREVAARCVLKNDFVSAKCLTDKNEFLSIGCNKLNDFLKGGIPLNGITEISGESGSGKTQICLQLSLCVQLPQMNGGLDAGAYYICTEDPFPSKRLVQMIDLFNYYDSDNCKINFGDNILIEHIPDVEGLKKCLFNRIPQILMQRKIGLLVIDSVAGVFRESYEPGLAVNRAIDLRQVGCQLHILSRKFKLSVVCINQVTDVIDQSSDINSISLHSIPALGLAWANMVTCRLKLMKTNYTIPDPNNREKCIPIKIIEVLFSSYLPHEKREYFISANGVHGV